MEGSQPGLGVSLGVTLGIVSSSNLEPGTPPSHMQERGRPLQLIGSLIVLQPTNRVTRVLYNSVCLVHAYLCIHQGVKSEYRGLPSICNLLPTDSMASKHVV